MLESLPILPSFLALLTPLRSCFPRQATHDNFAAICFGWIMALGRGRLSDALVAGGLVDKKHWTAFYRFFSRANWCIDALGLAVARIVVERFAPDGVIVIIVDDTLHAKGGKNVFGAGMHHDALTSTKKKARFQFGHCWVVLAISVRLPFATRPRALPVLFRLNVPPKMAIKWGVEHRKKTEQAAELVGLLASDFHDRQLLLTGDSAYSCKTVLRELPNNVEMVGRMPLGAALHSPVTPRDPHKRGRRAKWGPRMPTPEKQAEATRFWCVWNADIYGRTVSVRVHSFTAYWMSAGHSRLLHIVIVWRPNGDYPYEVFFSTDATLSPREIVEAYAERWCLEVTFYETKNSLGVDHPQPWTQAAVVRTAPTAMLLYSLVVVWYADHGHGSRAASWKHRPWYPHKNCTTFADMITTLRRATLHPAFSEEVGPKRDPEKLQALLLAWFREAA